MLEIKTSSINPYCIKIMSAITQPHTRSGGGNTRWGVECGGRGSVEEEQTVNEN
jgi:hypothetical protein